MQRDYKPQPRVRDRSVEASRQRGFGRFFEMAVAHSDGSQADMVAYIRRYDDQSHSLEKAFYRAMSDVIIEG